MASITCTLTKGCRCWTTQDKCTRSSSKTIQNHILRTLQHHGARIRVLMQPKVKAYFSAALNLMDIDNDHDGGNVLWEEPQSVTVPLICSPACRCKTTGGSLLPISSAQALLFICFPFSKENIPFFFIFRLGKRKQEVPPELHHTLPAQSTALRSVFLHWWVPAGQLICFRYFPMVNEGNTKALSWPGETTRLEYINLHTCPFWKMKFMAAHKKLYSCPYVLNKASCTSRVSLRQPDLMERGILGKGMA